PYDENNFPLNQHGSQFRSQGFRSDILSSRGNNVFIRHQAFKQDLTPVSPYESKIPHLMASAGFLTANPQHRTYWTVDTDLSYGTGGGYETDGPLGDIMVTDGNAFYEVRGYAPGRHSNHGLKPTLDMYRIVSGRRVPKGMRGREIPNTGGPTVPRMRKWETWARNWTAQIPIAGHAVLKASDKLVVAGVPMREGYTRDDMAASYAGTKGGLLWTLSAESGKATGEIELPAPPVWDGLAAVEGRIFVSLKDGSILCLDAADARQVPPKSRFIEGPTPIEKGGANTLRQAKGSVVIYHNDFESLAPGTELEGTHGTDPQNGILINVTDKAAASGKHAAVLQDGKTEHAWAPLCQTTFERSQILGGKVNVSCDLMIDADTPCGISLILRHYGDYLKPPNVRNITQLNLKPDNTIEIAGKVLPAKVGVWHHVEFSFLQGVPGKRMVKGTLTSAEGGSQSFKGPCESKDYEGLGWFSFCGWSSEPGIAYIDNIKVRIDEHKGK
ncbi:MAG: hypothetical protein HN341_11995, partial [Verrucomicrobia bacterium]|nr:hypothetical protein [Verrucomicrobiota bacterium]